MGPDPKMPAERLLPDSQEIIHATTVAVDGRGVLILGPSGAGKSSLALQLMSRGAELVADDRTIVTPEQGLLIARAPAAIKGRIEARGIGILETGCRDEAPIMLAIDLSETTMARMPEPVTYAVLGQEVPCLHRADHVHFPDAILLYLRQHIHHRR